MSFESSYCTESHEKIKQILIFGDKSLLLTCWVTYAFLTLKPPLFDLQMGVLSADTITTSSSFSMKTGLGRRSGFEPATGTVLTESVDVNTPSFPSKRPVR